MGTLGLVIDKSKLGKDYGERLGVGGGLPTGSILSRETWVAKRGM